MKPPQPSQTPSPPGQAHILSTRGRLGLVILILLFFFGLGPGQPHWVPEQSFLYLTFYLKTG